MSLRRIYPWFRRRIIALILVMGAFLGQGCVAPLHRAAMENDYAKAKNLIQQEVDVNSSGFQKETPLHYAALHGANEVALLLLEKGARVNALTSNGYTPLHYALLMRQTNSVPTIKLLLAHGADPAISVAYFGTPLEMLNQFGVHMRRRGVPVNEIRSLLQAATEQGKMPEHPAPQPAPVLSPRHWPLERVAIADITASGISADEAEAMAGWFHNSIEETKYFQLVARKDMNAILKEQEFQKTGSCDDSQCLVDMGKILTVGKIVGGSLGRIGDKRVLIMRLVDVETGEILCSAKGASNADSDSLIKMIGNVAVSLCAEYGKTRPPPK